MSRLHPSTSPFRSDVLDGRVALISGGGSGIGFAIAQAVVEHGGKVVIMGRRENVLEEASSKLNAITKDSAHFVQGDVRSYESAQTVVEQTVEKFGKLNLLVNCAAGNFLCPAKDLSSNGFKTVVDIDLNGTFNMCRAAFSSLKAAGNSLIINITATLHYAATWWQLHPSSAKAGVDALTRNLALEWGSYGIRTAGIAPGPIKDTEGMSRLSASMLQDQKNVLEEGAKKNIPVGRLGTVEDIAYMAVYLATDAASFISGETIVVDGGSWLYTPVRMTEEQLAMVTEMVRKKKSAL
eukprot:CAMPEP_0174262512 /NCGR_PEP_ID=MMETSP0439-20130205/13018_1 /TAXON_ID=0 /ORGANISM="Stereomyxa ramosa, Strain Chinc5" /LENGTH=294 /DNA_ID=CAMNT_0015347231 /DNA_START=29 /DNA_END=913 /DNA_ORIENTATION=-